MSDLQSTLDTIDAVAVHQCGHCDKPLPVDGPSPDFCGYVCQYNWNQSRDELVHLVGYREFSPTWCRERETWPSDPDQWQNIAAALARLGERLSDSVQVAGSAMAQFIHAAEAGVIDVQTARRQLGLPANEQQPAPAEESPRDRALRLRRNRNTGPQERQRAPRRIDARRAR